jgi:hypothetical protein
MNRVTRASTSVRRSLIALLMASGAGLSFLALGISIAWADAAPPDACAGLMSVDFSGIQDAPVQLMSTTSIQTSARLPAYCRVQGYISPNIGFDLWLPTPTHWNGKFFEYGSGGDGGSFPTDWPVCDNALRKGYACIVTDTGHKGSGGLWAVNNLQAYVDFAYRSTHLTAVAGKAITTQYYSKEPTQAYFEGCSTGGQEGLIEAQRFPWDFNGIIADAAWINDSDSSMHMVWGRRALTGKNGQPLMRRADVQRLHQAVLARCDMDDGVKDGIISNPLGCKFDPSELLCNPGQSNDCLSEEQVQAAKKVYSGPVNSRGEKLYPGGVALGSELSWVDLGSDFISTDGLGSVSDWALLYFRYMTLPPRGSHWEMSDYDFDRDPQRFASGTQESLLNAANPDLRKFKAAGGKLILVHGWQEVSSSPPANVIDYYETVTRTMGGESPTRDFARLFVVPGMDHCGGNGGRAGLSPGPYVVDYLHYLEQWVERGEAPDEMIGAHPKDTSPETFTSGLLATFPLDPATIAFTRPIYPYPAHAKYRGSGSPNDAANFAPLLDEKPGSHSTH